MLALLNVMRHFESFSQNAKILQWTHVDFGLASTGNSPGIYFLAYCLLAGSRARSDLPKVNQSLIYAHFIYSQTRAIK